MMHDCGNAVFCVIMNGKIRLHSSKFKKKEEKHANL